MAMVNMFELAHFHTQLLSCMSCCRTGFECSLPIGFFSLVPLYEEPAYLNVYGKLYTTIVQINGCKNMTFIKMAISSFPNKEKYNFLCSTNSIIYRCARATLGLMHRSVIKTIYPYFIIPISAHSMCSV